MNKKAQVAEKTSTTCINIQQNKGYMINICFGIMIVFIIFLVYKNNQIKSEDASRAILYLSGMFENMYDTCYYVPEVTHKFGIFRNNEIFLKKLLVKRERNVINSNFAPKNYDIMFDRVTFGYEDEKYIFDNFSCKIPQNEITLFFGKSGSGKTTLMKLLFQNIIQKEGQILIGDEDISTYDIGEIRNVMSYVGQNTSSLFNLSLYENIIYGYEDREEMRKVIEDYFMKFNFLDIFSNLLRDNSFSFLDDKVGKHGDRLSGGQKQVVHLLRLLLNPCNKIIILDEPTSALDEGSRNKVVDYLIHLLSLGKTLIIITHDEYFKSIAHNVLHFSSGVNPSFHD
jgi:ATP-binding cassette subfamily B protein